MNAYVFLQQLSENLIYRNIKEQRKTRSKKMEIKKIHVRKERTNNTLNKKRKLS